MPASQHQNPKSDIEISQSAEKRRILDVAKDKLGIAPENLEPYGHYKAKVAMEYVKSLQSKPNGKLILVTAISPTPAGEGKTTTTVGLTDALNHIGKKAICARPASTSPRRRKSWRSSASPRTSTTSRNGWATSSSPIRATVSRSAPRSSTRMAFCLFFCWWCLCRFWCCLLLAR